MKWLGALFIILLCSLFVNTGCALNEPYPYKSVPRTHINENCRVERNHGLSDEEFLKRIHEKYDGTGYKKIVSIEGTAIDMKIEIVTVVIYY